MLRTRNRHCSIAVTVLAILCAASAAQAQDTSTSPPLQPPGRLIDLGGWRLHLHCSGEARISQPTVILDAGAGDFSVDWSLVQPGVAGFARVCSYDRAGSGWSDLGPRPRTFRQQVWELHTLLEKAGERPPYVLVGHSAGGWRVRVYQSTYPSEVVGMVLVEAGTDDPVRMTPEGKPVRSSELATGKPVPAVKTGDPLRESDLGPRLLGMIQAQAAEFGRHANAPPRDKLPPDAQRMRTWSISQVKHHAANDNPFEAEELRAMFAERSSKEHVLGNLPLIVMSRGSSEHKGPDGQAAENRHQKEQVTLVALARSSKHVVAHRSGHHIPLDEPDLVVAAIRDVVGAQRR
jgi:pimeloyl-ACP methyl ester carboxylesterase